MLLSEGFVYRQSLLERKASRTCLVVKEPASGRSADAEGFGDWRLSGGGAMFGIHDMSVRIPGACTSKRTPCSVRVGTAHRLSRFLDMGPSVVIEAQ